MPGALASFLGLTTSAVKGVGAPEDLAVFQKFIDVL